MQDNKCRVLVWCIIGLTLVGIVLVVFGYSALADIRVAEMVEKGANPIAARCAIWGSTESTRIMCYEAAKLGK